MNPLYSATPGIPIRMAAVQEVVDKTFSEPKPMESLTIGVPTHDYEVKNVRSAFIFASPERRTGCSAFIFGTPPT